VATSTPPGWYPDPDDAAYLRWFDGTFWTDARASATPFIDCEPAPGPTPPPPGTLNIGGAVGQPNGLTVDFGQSVYPTAISIPAG
jgi:Protein of unknown function (DUF2510)